MLTLRLSKGHRISDEENKLKVNQLQAYPFEGPASGGGHNSICTGKSVWYRNIFGSFLFDLPNFLFQ